MPIDAAPAPAESTESTESTEATAPVKPIRPCPQHDGSLTPWALVLHDDDVNEMGFVCELLCSLTRLQLSQAFSVMLQAHREGESVVLRTHREHAELLAQQLAQNGLTVSLRCS